MTTTQMMKPQQAVATRQEFGAMEATSAVDAMSKALAAQAAAQVQARYIMAMQHPRRWPEVRQRLMTACRDPGFAEEAWYEKPAGREKIEGFSIRFAEEAARAMTNLDVQTFAIYDDEHVRVTRVSVVDLESNINESREVSIRKVVERRKSKGREVIGERTNSYGDTVYVVKATDDEIANVENARISKAKRNAILAMLRADIKAECAARIESTRRNASDNPAQWIKDMADRFAEVGVFVDDLEAWLGQAIEKIQQGDVSRLRTIYAGVRNGEISFPEEIEKAKALRAERLERAREEGRRRAEQPPASVNAEDHTVSTEDEERAPTPKITKADLLKYAQGLRLSQKERDEIINHAFEGKTINDLSPAELDQARLELESYAANRGES